MIDSEWRKSIVINLAVVAEWKEPKASSVSNWKERTEGAKRAVERSETDESE